MRRHLAALALLAAIASPFSANASVRITEGDNTYAVSDDNDFKTELLGLGYTQYTSFNAALEMIGANQVIDFYFLGSESGYTDTFLFPGGSYTEIGTTNHFAAPLFIGTGAFAPGTLAGLLSFDSNQGTDAGIGADGFGIFLNEDWVWNGGQTDVSSFILGFDDQIRGPDDDNHDDLMILAVVRSVPEPGTWAMLLLGFGALGAAMRRKSANVLRLRSALS